MKKLLAILSVVLFANQASAEDFKVGDKFTCTNHREVFIEGGADGGPYNKIHPTPEINLEDITVEIKDGVLFVKTALYRRGFGPADILGYGLRLSNFIDASNNYGYYALSNMDGTVQFGYAIVDSFGVVSGTATCVKQ